MKGRAGIEALRLESKLSKKGLHTRQEAKATVPHQGFKGTGSTQAHSLPTLDAFCALPNDTQLTLFWVHWWKLTSICKAENMTQTGSTVSPEWQKEELRQEWLTPVPVAFPQLISLWLYFPAHSEKLEASGEVRVRALQNRRRPPSCIWKKLRDMWAEWCPVHTQEFPGSVS